MRETSGNVYAEPLTGSFPALHRALAIIVASSWLVAVACREQPGTRKYVATQLPTAASQPTEKSRPAADSPPGSSLPPASVESRAATDAGAVGLRCREQPPQEFLVRAHLRNGPMSRDERVARHEALAEAIRYRTEQYGYYEGFGNRAWNPKTVSQQTQLTTFYGVPVVLHERVVPALRCVEQHLRRECSGRPYQPQILSGFRRRNTYFSGDVSNHVYGIALDIDPERNPCCRCVEPWRSNKRCKRKGGVVDRMDMPECWVRVFERYGFYWLGHDELEDSMHFEFLGDPSRILEEPPFTP